MSALQIGDPVITLSGRTKAIKWIGRRRLQPKDAAWAQMQPVQLMRSALDDDVPHRDLYLSPGHAIYIDGQLIPVGTLVNGRTIITSPASPEALEYFHIELFEPDVIFAEGTPTETFLPFQNLRMFDNADEYDRLYGAEQLGIHMPIAPVIPIGRRYQLHSRLRSAVSPWWDIRTPFDITRDRIDIRAEYMSRAA